jgi:hypothetical protein
MRGNAHGNSWHCQPPKQQRAFRKKFNRHEPDGCRAQRCSRRSDIIASFGERMGKIYTGIGYLTGRRLTFRSDLPINGSAVWVDDDSRTIDSDVIRKVENT